MEQQINRRLKNNILTVDIDLDLKPNDRYKNLISKFDIQSLKTDFVEIYKKYSPQIPGINLILSVVTSLNSSKIMYYDEIQYWANVFDLPFYQAVIMQLLYEINSGCTTVIADIKGKKTMIRTFDWPEPLLSKIIYQATFYKSGKKVYEGINILGSVGIFTGKNLEYSLAINYRRLNSVSLSTIFNNFINTVNCYWPVSYLIRYCLENKYSYEQTLLALRNNPVISPVYYSINNYKNKPVIIQRGTNSSESITGEYTIQTNCDCKDVDTDKDNIEYSFERYNLSKKIINNDKDIISSMLQFPIIRDDTIYISIIDSENFYTSIF